MGDAKTKKQDWFYKLSMVLSDLIISRVSIFIGAFISGAVAAVLAFYPSLNGLTGEVKALKVLEPQVELMKQEVQTLKGAVEKMEVKQDSIQNSLNRVEKTLGDINSYLIRR